MATYYVDPSASTNGSGTAGSPYNTWVGITLTANNTYLQKRGTTYTGAAVRPQNQSSAAATPLTIGAYFNADGSDDASKPKPIINHNGGTNGVGAVMIDTCTNVVVQDIAGTNSKGALGGGVHVRRSVGVLVQRCDCYDNEHGIIIQQDQAAATSVTTDVTVQDCLAYSNNGMGIGFRWGATSTAILERVKVLRNIVRNNGVAKTVSPAGGSIPAVGIGSYLQNKASIGSAGFVSFDLVVENNVVSDNNGYGVNIEGWGAKSWLSSVSRNDISGSGFSGDLDSHSLWVGHCFDLLIERNYVHDNFAWIGQAIGSGVGIFVDYNATSTNAGARCVVRGNLVERQWRGATSALNFGASAGIFVSLFDDTQVTGNVIQYCRNGIAIGTITTPRTRVANNTILNCDNCGIANFALATNTTITNNVISGTTNGIFINTTSTSGVTETYNAIGPVTTAYLNGTPTAPTATTGSATDSLGNFAGSFNSDGSLRNSNSSLATAGTYVSGVTLANGRLRPGYVPIGAYMAVLPRTART